MLPYSQILFSLVLYAVLVDPLEGLGSDWLVTVLCLETVTVSGWAGSGQGR